MTENQIKELGFVIYEATDISPALLEVTSRQINYWIDHGVIPFAEKEQSVDGVDDQKINKTKWIRLNLAQAVWVCIVKELISYNVSIENIKELARSIWQKPREEKYADKIFKVHVKNKKKILSDNTVATLKQNLEDELLMEHYFRTIINPFTDLLKSAVLDHKLPHSMVYVPSTNEHTFLEQGSELIQKIGSSYLERSMISIPIVPLIAKVLAVDYGNTKKDLIYISDIEKQIRDIIVFKKPKYVEIAFENNHIKPIVITEDHKTREDLTRFFMEHKIERGSKLLIEIRATDNYKITLVK